MWVGKWAESSVVSSVALKGAQKVALKAELLVDKSVGESAYRMADYLAALWDILLAAMWVGMLAAQMVVWMASKKVEK